MPAQTDVLSGEELDQLIKAALAGDSVVSDEDIHKLIQWATETRIANTILEWILRTAAPVIIRPDGEPEYAGPVEKFMSEVYP